MRARRPPTRAWPVAALVLLLVTATDSAARRHEPKPRAGDLPAGWETRIRVSPESGPTRSLDGETYVGVNDLARLQRLEDEVVVPRAPVLRHHPFGRLGVMGHGGERLSER